MTSSTVVDIDQKYYGNEYMLTDYVGDIINYLQAKEVREGVSANYMEHQAQITEKMRAVLIDWIVSMCHSYHYDSETLFLTVRILDRFLSKRSVEKSKLQLVGMTAMLIASKLEEVYSPSIRDLVHKASNQYRKEEFIQMERYMLGSLDWIVTSVTAHQFLNRFVRVAQMPTRTQLLAKFFGELALADFRMLKYQPSLLAAGCVLLANKVLGTGDWVRCAFSCFLSTFHS